MRSYTEINSETIDRWIDEGWEWGIPISHEDFLKAKNGDYNIFLTPTKPVPKEWIGNVKGKKILGLASGGGQQMPVLTALGAKCTVLDYSKKQIESELLVAKREGYSIKTLRADMTKRLPFDDCEFDLIIHPVSNCYIEDVYSVWNECYRVLRPGGIIISGTDHFVNYIVDESEEKIVHKLPFNPLKCEEHMKLLRDTDSGVQFSHTIEEQIGGQIKAGFIIKDIYEDTNGQGRLHELNIPTMLAIRSQKPF